MNENSSYQCIVDMLKITGKCRMLHASKKEGSGNTLGNIAYWRQKESGAEEYIFRIDVWSDSKQRFVETKWFPEAGSSPYFVNEYNDETETLIRLATPNG